ncbi:DUF4362 domain-containing protein [Lysinibacillus sp. FSL K6-0232]|uniref:DUF4362 domain-containing protein n=1 Tax=unclassified Lysinibacillus TaxID=2636778 RepID=UPI0030FBFD00
MKKFSLMLCVTFLSIVLLGCQEEAEMSDQKQADSLEEALANGDVVNLHGKISNLEKFTSFIENIQKGAKDAIRITTYTIEGDPIYYHLDYDGDKIQYTYDNSQDKYAGSGKGAQSTTCSTIASRSDDEGIEYYLSGCSSEVGDSFYFRYSQ